MSQNVTPERIQILSNLIKDNMKNSMNTFVDVNSQVSILALNAQIEAARAGHAGRTFSVVAEEMQSLSNRTKDIVHKLNSEVQKHIDEMAIISRQLSTDVRGQRLSDLALNNIDLIDRNLYERSCDVRWWATDSSLVEACKNSEDKSLLQYASKRMGIILNAYTVYFDLVLCDTNGNVIANGRPNEFKSLNSNVSNCKWYKEAINTTSDDEFGFETVHESPLVNNNLILAYSCAIRNEGNIIGVLGILFRWESLAQTVVNNTPLPDEEKSQTRVCICNKEGLILADTEGKILNEHLIIKDKDKIFNEKKNFTLSVYDGKKSIIAHASAPGYETYTTGWHSVIIQNIKENNANN